MFRDSLTIKLYHFFKEKHDLKEIDLNLFFGGETEEDFYLNLPHNQIVVKEAEELLDFFYKNHLLKIYLQFLIKENSPTFFLSKKWFSQNNLSDIYNEYLKILLEQNKDHYYHKVIEAKSKKEEISLSFKILNEKDIKNFFNINDYNSYLLQTMSLINIDELVDFNHKNKTKYKYVFFFWDDMLVGINIQSKFPTNDQYHSSTITVHNLFQGLGIGVKIKETVFTDNIFNLKKFNPETDTFTYTNNGRDYLSTKYKFFNKKEFNNLLNLPINDLDYNYVASVFLGKKEIGFILIKIENKEHLVKEVVSLPNFDDIIYRDLYRFFDNFSGDLEQFIEKGENNVN